MQDLVLPAPLSSMLTGFSPTRITLGRSPSRTYRLAGKASNLFLKVQPPEAAERLFAEKERISWLQGKLPVPEVVYYGEHDTYEYLLLTEVTGINASDKSLGNRLPFLMEQLGSGLRLLHELEIGDCPFDERLDAKIAEAGRRVACGLVDEADFDRTRAGRSAEELFEELVRKKPLDEDLVFTHGDCCLPNIMIDNGRVSGFIDLGRAGLADRYQDLALAARSIVYNFGGAYMRRFLESYGLKELDQAKADYYQLLDEFF